MSDETSQQALERGKKEGRIDALLEEHSEHLAKINGSVGDAAKAMDALTGEIHTLGRDTQRALADVERDLRQALRDLASDIRTLNEEGRLRDERVKVAAATLATETERRRVELADSTSTTDRKFTKRERLVALAIALSAVLLTALALYFGTR